MLKDIHLKNFHCSMFSPDHVSVSINDEGLLELQIITPGRSVASPDDEEQSQPIKLDLGDVNSLHKVLEKYLIESLTKI